MHLTASFYAIYAYGVTEMTEKQSAKKKGASGRPAVDQERRARLGQVIRRYRTAAGMDQAALAGRLGFTKTAVGNWELGLTRPDIDTLPRISELLHVPVTELLGLPDEMAASGEDRNLLDVYHRLDRYNRKTVRQLMDRLLFQQDAQERARLRGAYAALCLYEEAAAAGIGAPMQEGAGSTTVYALKGNIPGGADAVIHVNGASMEPTYPNGSYVYVCTGQEVSFGQIGIFLINGEAFIKEYRPEGLVSHNRRYKTIHTGGDTDVRCYGRVTGRVADGDLASGPLAEKIEAAFAEPV